MSIDLRELAVDRVGTRPPSARHPRHILTRYVLPCILIVGFLSLVAWASRDMIFPPTEVTVVPVFSTAAEVRMEGTPLFNAAGWIEPRPTPVRVAALAPGVVERLLVVEDQPVKAGEPIAELIKDDAKLAHDQALADLDLRQAELEVVKAAVAAARTRLEQPVHLEAALGEAGASLAKIDTQLKNLPFQIRRAEADYEAMLSDVNGKRAAKGVVAGVEIDIAESKANAAKALVDELLDRTASLKKEQAATTQRCNALKTQLALLADEKKALGEATALIKAANARVTQARVAVTQAKLRLDRMTVVAPIDGRVFRLIAHPGTRIGSGMTQMEGHDGSTVVTMYRPDMLQVRVDVRFEDIPQVGLHQVVEIGNPALSSPILGKVLFITSEADIQKNTLQVKVEILDPPTVLKPEMLVDVTFVSRESRAEGGESRAEGRESRAESRESRAEGRESRAESRESRVEGAESRSGVETRIFVPEQLIRETEGEYFVWLADQSEMVVRKQSIRIGSRSENGFIEVFDGLTVSSRLIASEGKQLHDGERITILGEEEMIGTAFQLPVGTEPSRPP